MAAMSEAPQADPIEVEVRDNTLEARYEALVGGELAGISQYEPRDGTVTFTHTIVLPDWEGKGVGSRLVRGALDDLRARGLAAVPACPYMAVWITRHPEYADLVPESERHRLEPR